MQVNVARVTPIVGGAVVLACLLLIVGAGCGGSGGKPSLTVGDVKAAFGGQGIELMLFSGASGSTQLVSSSPPTVEVEIVSSVSEAKKLDAPQQVNGVEVKPSETRNVLVWVDSHASPPFQQRVDAALAALESQ
jgi:hypothetical protein